ncbi:MAG: elongation factor P [Planctomycetota bacterium]
MNATDIRKGQVITYEGELVVVLEAVHLTPGNKRGLMQVKMKSLKKGNSLTHKFRTNDNVDLAFLDKREMEYLYQEGESFVFMDLETYEQEYLQEDLVGDLMKYVKLNEKVKVTFCEGQAIGVDLPKSVTLEVTHTEPGFRGDTATNVQKPATVETGLEVKVPPYIEIGEKVKIDTETGKFLERVREK